MNDKTEHDEVKTNVKDNKPVDENMGFYFSSSIKIHDPESGDVIVHMRGDN
jgi:hypothetical protein